MFSKKIKNKITNKQEQREREKKERPRKKGTWNMKVKKMGVFLCKNLDPWGQFHLTSGTLWYWLHDVTFYFQTNFLQHEVSSITHRREPPNYSPRNILLGEIFLPITIALDYFLVLLQVFRLIKYVASALAPCCRKKIECNADFFSSSTFPSIIGGISFASSTIFF